MFPSLEEIARERMRVMVKLLNDNQTEITEIFREKGVETFKLFGDDIPDTASGMAKINFLAVNAALEYLDIAELRQKLQTQIKTTVNIYTEKTLKDQEKNYQEIFDKAKTLKEILGTSLTEEVSTKSVFKRH